MRVVGRKVLFQHDIFEPMLSAKRLSRALEAILLKERTLLSSSG